MLFVGSVIFFLTWWVFVAGTIVCLLERRYFRRGRPKLATLGPLIASDLVRASQDASAAKGPMELAGPALAKWTNSDTLLFAPVQQHSAYRLEWFGQGRRNGDEVLLEARLSVGTLMVVLGCLVMAFQMAVMFAVAGWYPVTAALFGIGILAIRGYRRSFRVEKHAAVEILREIRNKLPRAI
jgi:hypothetical protein